MTSLSCSDCGAALKPNPRRKGTRCKPCNARTLCQSAEMREALSRAMSRRWANPNEAHALGRAISAGIGPEERERRRHRGKIHCHVRAAAAGSEARRRAAFTLSQTRLGWLPPEYRAEYFRLRSTYKYRAKQARRLIEKQIEKDRAQYLATGRLPQSERLEGTRI